MTIVQIAWQKLQNKDTMSNQNVEYIFINIKKKSLFDKIGKRSVLLTLSFTLTTGLKCIEIETAIAVQLFLFQKKKEAEIIILN